MGAYGIPTPLLLGDGSGSAPAYAFAAEPTTGHYRIGAANIGHVFSGSLRRTETGSAINLGSGITLGWSSSATVGAAADTTLTRVAAGVLGVGSALAIGTSPASAGTLRLANTATVQFRNAANSADIQALTVDGSNQVTLGNSGNTTVVQSATLNLIANASSINLTCTNFNLSTAYATFSEIADPGVAAADGARLYARDSGGGKTQLVVVFSSGAVQVLATEP